MADMTLPESIKQTPPPTTTPTEKPPTDLVPKEPTRALYDVSGMQPFSSEARKILLAPVEQHQLDILPTGEVYMAQVHYRKRLNEAFGPGGWLVRPVGPITVKDNCVMREYALIVDGRFVSQAVGEANYIPNNARMSYATAAEASKSNAIMRLCKDIGIASECWDRKFTEEFKKQLCVKVYRLPKKPKQPHKHPWQWRLKDAAPFEDEVTPPANAELEDAD